MHIFNKQLTFLCWFAKTSNWQLLLI